MYNQGFWKLSTFLLLGILILVVGYLLYSKVNAKSEWDELISKAKGPSSIDRNPSQAAAFNDYFYSNPTQIKFEQELYDLDTIVESAEVKHEIRYTNIGNNPFFVVDVKVSCGCTVPSYQNEPVAPGQQGVVTIAYQSKGKSGFSMNKLTLYGNVPGNEVSTYFKIYVKPKI